MFKEFNTNPIKINHNKRHRYNKRHKATIKIIISQKLNQLIASRFQRRSKKNRKKHSYKQKTRKHN